MPLQGSQSSTPRNRTWPTTELLSDEIIEADAARDDVAARPRQVHGTVARAQERFDLLRLDEGDVLSRLVGAPEIPVAFDAFARDDANARLLDQRLAIVECVMKIRSTVIVAALRRRSAQLRSGRTPVQHAQARAACSIGWADLRPRRPRRASSRIPRFERPLAFGVALAATTPIASDTRSSGATPPDAGNRGLAASRNATTSGTRRAATTCRPCGRALSLRPSICGGKAGARAGYS
jgi:hypothetical protein